MGFWHASFARSIKRIGGFAADLYLSNDNRLVGQGVVYIAILTDLSLGVVYYIAVEREYRGRGLGKVLLASLEEILAENGADLFLATTSSSNTASRRLFKSLGYEEFFWRDLYRSVGEEETEILRMITCGYEDDVLFVKEERRSSKDLFEVLREREYVKRDAEKIWRVICYIPWVRLRRFFR